MKTIKQEEIDAYTKVKWNCKKCGFRNKICLGEEQDLDDYYDVDEELIEMFCDEDEFIIICENCKEKHKVTI